MEVRKFENGDWEIFRSFAETFYASDSVVRPIPEAHVRNAFAEILSDSAYLKGYMILREAQPAGYALLLYSYSMEAGGRIAFLDELFITPDHRGAGLGSAFIRYMQQNLSHGIRAFRLEVMPEKENLRRLYERQGFRMMPYASMIREMD